MTKTHFALFFAVLLLHAARADAQRGAMSGRILEASTERPVSNARIQISSRSIEALSDSAGRFRISNVHPGTFIVVIKAVGFDSLVARIMLREKDEIDADFMMSPSVTTLAPVTVDASRKITSWRLEEFEGRQKLGFGRFLDKSYFEANASRSLESLLISRIPGIRTRRVAGKMVVTSSREGALCYPQVVVNGISVWNGVPLGPDSKVAREVLLFDIYSINTPEMLAFEFHTPATTPFQYNATGAGRDGSSCGTAIIWTK